MSNSVSPSKLTNIQQVDTIWTMNVQQQVFRKILEAMSHPGSIFPLTNLLGENPAYKATLATLLDNEVTLSDHNLKLSIDDWPHLQAEPVCASTADYILCDAALKPDFQPKLGTLPSPDYSATIVLIVDKLGEGDLQLQLTGPGINGSTTIIQNGLHPDWLQKREEWNCSFPLGVDMIFTDKNQIMALPRTTHVERVL